MTQEEITAAINAVLALPSSRIVWATANEQQRAEQNKQEKVLRQACGTLSDLIRQAEDRDLFGVLFPLACGRFNPFEGPTVLSAHLLLQLKPLCPVSCTAAIRRISRSEWDLSLEEVPWYVADQFGTEEVYQGLDALEADTEIRALRKALAVRIKAWDADAPKKMSMEQFGKWSTETPYDDVCVRLDSIRYWTDILVKDEGGKIENWHPFWWRG